MMREQRLREVLTPAVLNQVIDRVLGVTGGITHQRPFLHEQILAALIPAFSLASTTGGVAQAVARVQRLDRAATPGPWTVDRRDTTPVLRAGSAFAGTSLEDLELIAAYRSDAVELAAEIESLHQQAELQRRGPGWGR